MSQNQRRFDRVPEALTARCRPAGALQDPWQTVITVDLSAGGMSFESGHLVEEGSGVELELHLPGAADVTLRGRVVRAASKGPGAAEIAVEFMDMSPEQQAQIDTLVQFLRKRG